MGIGTQGQVDSLCRITQVEVRRSSESAGAHRSMLALEPAAASHVEFVNDQVLINIGHSHVQSERTTGPHQISRRRTARADCRHRPAVKLPSTSQPARGASVSLRIRAGAIFSNCCFKSSANSTGVSALRMGISPSSKLPHRLGKRRCRCRTDGCRLHIGLLAPTPQFVIICTPFEPQNPLHRLPRRPAARRGDIGPGHMHVRAGAKQTLETIAMKDFIIR